MPTVISLELELPEAKLIEAFRRLPPTATCRIAGQVTGFA